MNSSNTLFLVLLHGNEDAPLQVIRRHFKSINYLIANKPAFRQKVRYLQTDLNRSFPGRFHGSLEEKLASKLLKLTQKYPQVIDLHTATCSTPPFLILTKISPSHLKLARSLGVKNLVFMQKSIASGHSFIDYHPLAISLEAGYNNSLQTHQNLHQILNYYQKRHHSHYHLDYFTVVNILPRRPNEFLFPQIKAFKLVKKNSPLSHINRRIYYSPYSFYPVLPRERNYSHTLCLVAKKITITNFLSLGG